MTVNTGPVVVLISSDFEWQIVKKIVTATEESKTPFGEQFVAQIGQRELLFFHGGWGKIAAAASTQYAIDTFQPKLLVNIGTCGSFHQSMQRGNLLLADKTVVYDIVEQMGDPDEAINAYTTVFDTSWAQSLEGVQHGVLISGDRDIAPGDIKTLRSKYSAAAADWESGAIAWAAKKNNVPLFIIRGVSDVVSETESLAYSDPGHFKEGAEMVMKQLIAALPDCLDLWGKDTKK
ncbi:MAG TPA: 5'-methylthioadenosine/S-adenosylhomocysteine nucleosidase [Candidatus Saccharimonadales bacterium]|nr:5'-methylthioadenosine/S-adenosylhomocysteine nucleosidase [Candidatus Saccharimonadales bacterium]